MPPVISAPRSVRNTKLVGWVRLHKSSFWLNLTTLCQHFQGQMMSSMQTFRHFWRNVQGFALAGVAPKLRKIDSISKLSRGNTIGLLNLLNGL